MADDTEVLEIMHRVQRAMHRSKLLTSRPGNWALATNLTMAQLRALMTLADCGDLTVGQLAARLGVGMPAASSIVERLVEEGLAERHQDPADRRRTLVHPSATGSEQIDRMRQGPKEVVLSLVAALSAEEKRCLMVAMRAIARAAEEMEAALELHESDPVAAGVTAS